MKIDSKIFSNIINEALEEAKSYNHGPRQHAPAMQDVYTRVPTENMDPRLIKSQLSKAAAAATKLELMIKDGEILDEMLHTKISKASDYLTSVLHYLEYQEKRGER